MLLRGGVVVRPEAFLGFSSTFTTSVRCLRDAFVGEKGFGENGSDSPCIARDFGMREEGPGRLACRLGGVTGKTEPFLSRCLKLLSFDILLYSLYLAASFMVESGDLIVRNAYTAYLYLADI